MKNISVNINIAQCEQYNICERAKKIEHNIYQKRKIVIQNHAIMFIPFRNKRHPNKLGILIR